MSELKYNVRDRISVEGTIEKVRNSGRTLEVVIDGFVSPLLMAPDEVRPNHAKIRNAALEESIAVLDRMEEDSLNPEDGAKFGMAAARIRALRTKEPA